MGRPKCSSRKVHTAPQSTLRHPGGAPWDSDTTAFAANSRDAQDAEQVQKNLEAIHKGLELVEESPICGRLIRETHDVLFSGAPRVSKRPGEYRITSTRIGGRNLDSIKQSFEDARFVPPPASRVQQCMKELEDFVNLPEKHGHLPVVVQMALMHYQFETIHPFCDGNGRIGRLVTSLLLKSRGALPKPILCLSAYMDEHRDEYTDRMLAVSQRGKWHEWVEFFLRGVKQQADEDVERCARLVALRDSYLAICDQLKVPVAVIDALFGFPATTMQKAADVQHKTFATGRRVVEALEGAGIVIEVTGKPKDRIYLAQPIIDLLEGPLSA